MASDMRLNDKPIAKDGAYIYAETADGRQVKISKADLATVVAEQFGYNILDVSDLNDIKKTGAWSLVDANLDVKNNPTRYGVLLSFYIGGQYTWLQMTMRRTGGAIQYRTCSQTNEWSEWSEG